MSFLSLYSYTIADMVVIYFYLKLELSSCQRDQEVLDGTRGKFRLEFMPRKSTHKSALLRINLEVSQ